MSPRLRVLTAVLFLFLASTLAYGEQTYHKKADWLREHGKQAGRVSSNCYQCHKASVCSDCHAKHQDLTPEVKNPEKVESLYHHRADYRTRHANEARTDPARCLRCHTTQNCQSCHNREGLTTGLQNFPHPIDWVATHGRVARQDIVLCASCHERGTATNCINCHSTRSTVIRNPHPPGWSTSLSKSAPACVGCH